MSGIPSTDDRQTPSFSVLYVILGGAALLSAVIIPLAIMFTVRYVRRRSQPPEQQPPGAPGVTTRGNLEQEEPKLFDVYVKPGLEMHEARFEYILVSRVLRSTEPANSNLHSASYRSRSVHAVRDSCYSRFVNLSKCTADALPITQSAPGGLQRRSAYRRGCFERV